MLIVHTALTLWSVYVKGMYVQETQEAHRLPRSKYTLCWSGGGGGGTPAGRYLLPRWGTPCLEKGYPLVQTWEGGTPRQLDWVPPPDVNRQTPVKTVPSLVLRTRAVNITHSHSNVCVKLIKTLFAELKDQLVSQTFWNTRCTFVWKQQVLFYVPQIIECETFTTLFLHVTIFISVRQNFVLLDTNNCKTCFSCRV